MGVRIKEGHIEIRGNDVYFSNGHLCGEVYYDTSWGKWRFRPGETQTFDSGFMIDIGRALKQLK